MTNFDIGNYAELLSKKNPMDNDEEGKEVIDKQPQQLNLKGEIDAQDDQLKCEGTEVDRYVIAQDFCAMRGMLVESHEMMNEDDLSWDSHFKELPIPNLSDVIITKSSELHCELPSLFDDYIGFEDNLDFMFDLRNGEECDKNLMTILPTMTPSSSTSSLTCLSTSPTSPSGSYDDYLV